MTIDQTQRSLRSMFLSSQTRHTMPWKMITCGTDWDPSQHWGGLCNIDIYMRLGESQDLYILMKKHCYEARKWNLDKWSMLCGSRENLFCWVTHLNRKFPVRNIIHHIFCIVSNLVWFVTPVQINGLVQERCNSIAFDGLVQERRNSTALAMELCLFCINPSKYWCPIFSRLPSMISVKHISSFTPRIFEWKFRWVIFKIILAIFGWGISCEIVLKWISLDLADDKSTLVQVMGWCRQATSHYPSQCWPSSMLPYGVTRPHWVNWEMIMPPVTKRSMGCWMPKLSQS